jgi:hypothetical protein
MHSSMTMVRAQHHSGILQPQYHFVGSTIRRESESEREQELEFELSCGESSGDGISAAGTLRPASAPPSPAATETVTDPEATTTI